MWDRTKEAHRAAGCKLDPFGGGDRHSKTCPDKKYLAWVRRRPWKKLRDADLVNILEDEMAEYLDAWQDFHTDKGCTTSDTVPVVWNHTGCNPRDREYPDTNERWERLANACYARGCEWTDGWAHVEGCRFWRWASKADAEEAILGRVKYAMEKDLPENALKVLRAIADIGLGSDESHTPSIDVMASRRYLADHTELSTNQVFHALEWLVKHEYLVKIEDVEDIGLDFMRRNAKRLRREGPGRPANWYRILPPPPPPFEMRPSGRLDKLLAAAG